MVFTTFPLKVSIGPSIGICCYEVDEIRFEAFRTRFPESKECFKSFNGRFWLDLKGFNRDALIKAGIRREYIDTSKFCTSCRSDLFYSYRRDGENTGRHYSGIMLEKT
jgi:hypothetical protein